MRRLAVVFLALVLLVTACGSTSTDANDADLSLDGASSTEQQSSDQESQPATEPTAEPAEEPASAATADGPTVNESFVSPVADALGFDPDDRLAESTAYVRLAEENVQRCMAAAGFDYEPLDSGFGPSFESRIALEASLTDEQFVEQYGYGIATLFEQDFKGEGVMVFVDQMLGVAPAVERSPAEQEAYDMALSGESLQGLSAEEAQSQTFDGNTLEPQPGSCRQTGYANAATPQGEIFEGFRSLLGDEFDALDDRFDSDSRVRDHRREWQRCMGEAGFAYESPDEIRSEIGASANDIGNRFTRSPEVLVLFAQVLGADLTNMNDSDRLEFIEGIGGLEGFSIVPGLQAELDDLMAFELDVVGRSFECTDGDLMRDVRAELEQQFVESNAEKLALVTSDS